MIFDCTGARRLTYNDITAIDTIERRDVPIEQVRHAVTCRLLSQLARRQLARIAALETENAMLRLRLEPAS